jgi:hypothetical protein
MLIKIYAQEINDVLRSADNDIKTSLNIISVNYDEEERPFPLEF